MNGNIELLDRIISYIGEHVTKGGTMTPREKTNYLLGEIAGTLEIKEGLSLNNEDTCLFTIDERFGFIVCLDDESEQLLINLPLGVLPDGESGRDLALEMLAGNYAWGLTAGATLGLDDETGILCLCHNFDVSQGKGGGFESLLSDMIGAAAYWLDKIEEAGDSDLPSPEMGRGLRV